MTTRLVQLSIVVVIGLSVHPATARALTFEQLARTIDTRYSRQLEASGFAASLPTYGTPRFTPLGPPRDTMLGTAYFRFRAAAGDPAARQRMLDQVAVSAASLAAGQSASFGSAQAAFLLVRMLDTLPTLWTNAQRQTILQTISTHLSPGLAAPDTENRALTSAAHWQYTVDQLAVEGVLTADDRQRAAAAIKTKVDRAIRESISSDGWYREGKSFTVHYHVVSAYNLLFYGQQTKQRRYVRLAEKMYANAKRLSLRNGLIEARLGHRPIGLGAQFYIMMGVLGTVFGDRDAPVYFTYAGGSRFFSDRRHPGRLEFHRTIEGQAPYYHDDIATSDVIEMAFVMPGFSVRRSIPTRTYLRPGVIRWQDRDFSIVNDRRTLTVSDLVQHKRYRVTLGSYGNWAHLEGPR